MHMYNYTIEILDVVVVMPIVSSISSRCSGAGLLDSGRLLPPLDGLVSIAKSAVRYSFSRYSLGRHFHPRFGN